MRLKCLIRHLGASVLLAVSGAAFAVPTDLGVLDANGAQFEHSWARLFGQGSTVGPFVDSYSFSLSGASDAVGSMFKFDFGSLDLVLNSVSLTQIGSLAAPVVDTSANSFMFAGLAAGSYLLDVAGSLNMAPSLLDIGGAHYKGTIKSFASPAPEPATLVMGLAGLLAVGSMVRSRRKG